MKIVHFASEIGGGGAARSTFNLHKGLLDHGVESVILAGEIHGDAPPSVVKSPYMADVEQGFTLERELMVWGNRTNLSNTHFSLNLPGNVSMPCDFLRGVDVIHLHWVAGSLSASSISALAELGKPLVWTLHDMRPLTGGCHFPAGCEGYAQNCRHCPQLINDLDGLVEKNKDLLSRAIKHAGIHLVAPSSWMLERVNKATSVGKNEVSFIPYGVDASHFKLGEKPKARCQLGLDPEAMYILLAAHHAREHRKGFDRAWQVLEQLSSDPVVSSMVTDGTLRVLVCGNDSGDIKLPGYKVESAGHLDFQTMPLLYQSADLLLYTSLEDNMPNVVMEALSCGLPVIGHDLGGVRDLVGNHGSDSDSGCLFPIGETGLASSIIKKLLCDESSRRLIGEEGRKKMESMFSLEHQAKAYLELYGKLIGKPPISLNAERISRDQEYRVLMDAISQKGKNLEKTHRSVLHQMEASRIVLGSKWVRLGQAVGICYKP